MELVGRGFVINEATPSKNVSHIDHRRSFITRQTLAIWDAPPYMTRTFEPINEFDNCLKFGMLFQQVEY